MDKFLYEKAIEGYQQHHRNFNHWMNMYAIFNGALFVGYYSLKKEVLDQFTFLEFLILLLGLVAGWFWYFSVRGFYRWILSWIGVVAYYENELNKNYQNNEKNKQPPIDIFLYRMFMHHKDNEFFFYYPFSTQKLTRRFVFVVASAWSVLLFYFLYRRIIFPIQIPCCCKNIFYVSLAGIVVLFILVTAFCKYDCGCREHLENSHIHFVQYDHSTFKKKQ